MSQPLARTTGDSHRLAELLRTGDNPGESSDTVGALGRTRERVRFESHLFRAVRNSFLAFHDNHRALVRALYRRFLLFGRHTDSVYCSPTGHPNPARLSKTALTAAKAA